MAEWGLTTDDVAADYEIETYRDTHRSILIFSKLTRQWRMSNVGPYGLDYVAVRFVFECEDLPQTDWEKVLDDIRVMEDAATEKMRENHG